MRDDSWPEAVGQFTLTLQIIVGALVAGVLSYLAIVLLVVRPAIRPPGIIDRDAAAVAGAMIVASTVVPARWLQRPGNKYSLARFSFPPAGHGENRAKAPRRTTTRPLTGGLSGKDDRRGGDARRLCLPCDDTLFRRGQSAVHCLCRHAVVGHRGAFSDPGPGHHWVQTATRTPGERAALCRRRIEPMSEVNPFASPLSCEPATAVATEDWQSQCLYRKGRLLVMHKQAVLPDRCVKSNQPVHGRRLKRKLTWHDPVLYFILPVDFLVYLITVLILRKRATIYVGLGEEWFRKRRGSPRHGWTLVVGGRGDVGGRSRFHRLSARGRCRRSRWGHLSPSAALICVSRVARGESGPSGSATILSG